MSRRACLGRWNSHLTRLHLPAKGSGCACGLMRASGLILPVDAGGALQIILDVSRLIDSAQRAAPTGIDR
ncbi:MAG: hypothetical protein O9325_00825, partial [Roseomonas sp.]|nr:hypothetical protein [Roseomonas sp.]